MKLPLRHRAVPEKTDRHVRPRLQGIGECQADGQRQSAGHDGVAAVDAMRDVEEMHRPAAASAAAGRLAEHLRHHSGRRHAAGHGMGVLPVGGHDPVLGCDSGQRPDRHRLLPDREMQKPADLALHVEFGRPLLESPDQEHLPQEVVRMVPGESGRRRHGPGSTAPGGGPASSIERSPSGSPNSRALSSRRMILPLRVLGSAATKSSSFGAIAAPSRLRA